MFFCRSLQPLRTLKELCTTVVSAHLPKIATLDGLGDELVQHIHDADRERRITPHIVKLFAPTQLSRLTIHVPFPAYKIDQFVAQLVAPQDSLVELDLQGEASFHPPPRSPAHASRPGCNFLTDRGMSSLARCSSLTSLNLAKCSRVTDWGVSELRGLIKLKVLNLAGCGQISEQSIKLLRGAPYDPLAPLRVADSLCRAAGSEGAALVRAIVGADFCVRAGVKYVSR